MNRKVGEQMSHRERLQNIADQNGGIFRTSDLTKLGYDSNGIRKLVADRVIERIKPSYFRLYGEDAKLSEAAQVAQLFPDGVLCMYSALFYYKSLNAFINRAINETMERDGSGKEAE